MSESPQSKSAVCKICGDPAMYIVGFYSREILDNPKNTREQIPDDWRFYFCTEHNQALREDGRPERKDKT